MNQPDTPPEKKPSILFRGFAIVYALFAYGVGAAALVWFFLASTSTVSYSLSDFKTDNLFIALTINSFLVFLFALQHTIRARKSFKQKWTRVIPAHLERSTFVLTAGIVMALILWYWQILPGAVWSIEHDTLRFAVLGIASFGVAYVLFSTLIASHFELLGLRQAWLYATGRPYTPVNFKRHWVYRYSRHPMMLGLLIVLWSTPDMMVLDLC